MKRDLATPGDFPGFKAAFYCNLKNSTVINYHLNQGTGATCRAKGFLEAAYREVQELNVEHPDYSSYLSIQIQVRY
jgi:hypothetical protein